MSWSTTTDEEILRGNLADRFGTRQPLLLCTEYSINWILRSTAELPSQLHQRLSALLSGSGLRSVFFGKLHVSVSVKYCKESLRTS